MKISEYKDEKALEVVAELIEPVAKICADKEVINAFKDSKLAAIKTLIKNHKAEVMLIMATLDDTPVEDYHINILTLPKKLLEILNDEDFMSLFTYAEQTTVGKSSGSAMENTKA